LLLGVLFIITKMKSTPVICGMDLGSWSFKLCAFNGEKLEVLTNEANFRETPSLVGYTATERLIG
jgi:molecular chaperone DnaK (HSP70)